MKLGVIYPQFELGGDPAAVRTIGLALEEEGFDYISAYDHVLGAEHADRDPPLTGPYTENDPFHDPLVMFAYLSGITKRLEMASGIMILPQRQTALVAKQALDLALFSGDRFRLGVGTGWNWVEYEALGIDFKSRGARLDDQVEMLRKLWTGEVVSHSGPFETFERASLVIKPRKPIQIWLGGFTDRAFRRAARVGDGFMFGSVKHWDRVRTFLEEEGRPASEFGRELMLGNPISAQEMADEAKRWRDDGHTHACFGTLFRGFTELEQHLDFAFEVKRLVG